MVLVDTSYVKSGQLPSIHNNFTEKELAMIVQTVKVKLNAVALFDKFWKCRI